MGINPIQKTTTMHQKSSMLQKQMYDNKETKAEADKCKLHHKNLSVAPSMDVYNNHSSQSLSLWS
jgi:hypothetical protein